MPKIAVLLALNVLCAPMWALAKSDNNCLDCHGDKDIKAESERGKTLKLYVKKDALKGTVHEDLSCTDCHQNAKTWDEAPHNDGKPLQVTCGTCHEDAQKAYSEECIHGKARANGNTKAPYCHDCHGSHDIVSLSSKDSRLAPIHQPKTCGRCHGADNLQQEGITKRRLLKRYYDSVHWQGMKEGKPAASCVDCHGKHCILPSSEADSQVSRLGLLASCKKCHAAIVQTYIKGSHGRTLLHGNLDVPTCTTCHGDHDMTSLKKTQAGGTRNFAGTQICIWCHGNERMMKRYALDTSPVDSYMRDFHGLTQRGTEGASATCADCHEAHHALPASHPESRMNISNRGTTCGKCHGKTSESFIMSFTHRSVTVDHGGAIKNIVLWAYLILIFGTIGLMLIHNAIIWRRWYLKKKSFQAANAFIVRLNRIDRIWHWVLLFSFSTLVFTGFALKFPDSVFLRWLYSLGFSETVRAWIHRVAAVVMTSSMAFLFLYQLFSKRNGRKWLTEMLPRRQDVRDFIANMRYHLGLSRERPRFDVFSYMEKAEYWALIWGTLIMVVTGIVLWFPKSLPDNWPSWAIDLARLIHFYEAILASLAILVWHFFHTIFRPDEYPMDTTWLTGVLTQEEAEHRFTDEAIQKQLPPKESDLEPPEKPNWVKDDKY